MRLTYCSDWSGSQTKWQPARAPWVQGILSLDLLPKGPGRPAFGERGPFQRKSFLHRRLFPPAILKATLPPPIVPVALHSLLLTLITLSLKLTSHSESIRACLKSWRAGQHPRSPNKEAST